LPLRDMEMVQFHPTGLLAGDHTKMTGTVLEEGLRGAGGQLLNGSHNRFMYDYDKLGERATRDVVSRGIYAEMRKNNTSQNGGVFISMAHLGPDFVRQKFNGMVKRCADSGFDLAAGLVEVVPTAHYFMGGVVVDSDTRTAIEGLYVAGEDAGGAHGSNRLGGNGVANSTVYGGVAGDTMGTDIRNMGTLRDPDEQILDREIERANHPLSLKPGNIHRLRHNLQEAMWEDVGVMRTRNRMERGIKKIDEIRSELMLTGVENSDLAFNLTWHDWLNMASLCDISEVIAKAGIARENSRGAHFREDYPESGIMEGSTFTVSQKTGDAIDVTHEQVQFTVVQPGQTILPDHEPESLLEAR
jgi:fumarate reductase flavoprotein subunit